MSALHMSEFGGLVVMLLFADSTALLGQPPAGGMGKPQTDFYPLNPGNKWDFQLDLNNQSHRMMNQVAKVELVDGKSLARVETSINRQPPGLTEHLTSNDKGVYRYL